MGCDHTSLLTVSVPLRRFQTVYCSHRPPLGPNRPPTHPHHLGSTFRLTDSTDTGPRPCPRPRAWVNRRNTCDVPQRVTIAVSRRLSSSGSVLRDAENRSATWDLSQRCVPDAQRHSERGSLTVALTGRGRSSGPAHKHARIKPCRLACVESAPVRDVWQPEAATRANSCGQSVHHNCRAHTRRVVMWSGRSNLIAPAAQTVLSACVDGVLTMPASVCHSLYTVCDGRRYAAFTSGTHL